MNKTVLLYNFSTERIRLVRRALAPLGCTVKGVSKKEYAQPIGALAGVPATPLGRVAQGGDFDEEMLVMSGFTGDGIDIVIGALRAGGVGSVPLKAVVTETNAEWDAASLYREIRAEHELMRGMRQKEI